MISQTNAIIGVATLENKMIILLDVVKLLSAGELAELSKDAAAVKAEANGVEAEDFWQTRSLGNSFSHFVPRQRRFCRIFVTQETAISLVTALIYLVNLNILFPDFKQKREDVLFAYLQIWTNVIKRKGVVSLRFLLTIICLPEVLRHDRLR